MNLPGYTVSLLLWIVPVTVLMLVLWRCKKLQGEVGKALAISAGIITILGTVLDLVFAKYFFTFPNTDAVLGIRIHGIPVEEFGFYLFGGWFIALCYVWCDEIFLVRYNRDDHAYRRWAKRLSSVMSPTKIGWFWVLGAAIGGVALKLWLNPEGMPIPGYFLFLLAAAYVPFVLFYRLVRNFVNWQGFVLTLFITLFISILWEVTLAIPLGWWGYQEGAMLGIFIQPWSRLPIEAVTVWCFSMLGILLYEAVKIRAFRPANLKK